MTTALHLGDATKDVTGIAVHKGGALKDVTEGWIRVAGALKQFYAKLGISLSTTFALGRGNSASVVSVTTQTVTATATGVVGTVTYAWTRTDADPQPWTIDEPAAQATTFTTSCDQGASFEATFICTVTDQAGQVIASAPVTADCANIYYGGGFIGAGGIHGLPYA